MDNNTIERIVAEVVSGVKGEAGVGSITLEQAKRLAREVEKKASQMGVKAVVAVSNTAARPVLVECMDDSYIASYDVAFNKAYTVVALKMSTIALKDLAQPGQSLYGIQFTNGGKIVIFGGGVALKNHDGKVVGGVGVSGGSEAEDTILGDFANKVFMEEIL